MYKYLENHILKDIINYLSSRCKYVINEQHIRKSNTDYFRGLYKGYLIAIKTLKVIIREKIRIKEYELYNHFKLLKNKYLYEYTLRREFGNGITEAFYDILNYISRK